jgi:hypothetical protein
MTHFNLLNRREKEEAEPYMTGNITSMWSWYLQSTMTA